MQSEVEWSDDSASYLPLFIAFSNFPRFCSFISSFQPFFSSANCSQCLGQYCVCHMGFITSSIFCLLAFLFSRARVVLCFCLFWLRWGRGVYLALVPISCSAENDLMGGSTVLDGCHSFCSSLLLGSVNCLDALVVGLQTSFNCSACSLWAQQSWFSFLMLSPTFTQINWEASKRFDRQLGCVLCRWWKNCCRCKVNSSSFTTSQ